MDDERIGMMRHAGLDISSRTKSWMGRSIEQGLGWMKVRGLENQEKRRVRRFSCGILLNECNRWRDHMPKLYWFGTFLSGVILLTMGTMEGLYRILPIGLMAIAVIGYLVQTRLEQKKRRP